MHLRQGFLKLFFAALAFGQLAFAPGIASAQQYAPPTISGFDVKQVARLSPGSELVFTLYATAGADTRISLEGINTQYLLPEVEPGVYVGSYTIRTSDRLSALSMVTANVRLGNQVATAVLDESLVAGAPWRSRTGSVPSGLAPRIERFTVAPTSRIEPGSELFFTLAGTPAGKASVRLNGMQGKIFLDETTPGNYQGSYTVKTRDRIAADSKVTANLRVGDRQTDAALRTSLVGTAATQPVALPPRVCANCGTVEAINAIEVKGDGGYIGLIGGGLAGVVLGSQVGNGKGKTAAQVLGAVGGAYAGREIEKNVRKNTHYEVVTRLESGGTQTIAYPALPAFKVGDRVRIENNLLVAAQ
ncbi:MAG: glycine zipper protein [Polaromonas sp.]|nr:glycine zipper protein [Polaromonas sp.]